MEVDVLFWFFRFHMHENGYIYATEHDKVKFCLLPPKQLMLSLKKFTEYDCVVIKMDISDESAMMFTREGFFVQFIDLMLV